jgi:hypothetical protein
MGWPVEFMRVELVSLQGKIVRNVLGVPLSKEDLFADARERAERVNHLKADKAEINRAYLFEILDLSLVIRDLMDLHDVSAAEVARRIGLKEHNAQAMRKLADVADQHRRDIIDNEHTEDYEYPSWRDLVPRKTDDVPADVPQPDVPDGGPRLLEISRQLVIEINKPAKQRDDKLIDTLKAEQATLRAGAAPVAQPVPDAAPVVAPKLDFEALYLASEKRNAELQEKLAGIGHNSRNSRNSRRKQSGDEFGTPRPFVEFLLQYLVIHADMCSTAELAVVPMHFDIKADGLKQDWSRFHNIFCNCPYSNPLPWVRKCKEHGDMIDHIAIALLPNKCSPEWYTEWVAPFADVIHIGRRLQFIGGEYYARDDSILAVWSRGALPKLLKACEPISTYLLRDFE